MVQSNRIGNIRYDEKCQQDGETVNISQARKYQRGSKSFLLFNHRQFFMCTAKSKIDHGLTFILTYVIKNIRHKYATI